MNTYHNIEAQGVMILCIYQLRTTQVKVCGKAYGNVCSYPYFKCSGHFKSKHEQYIY